MLGGHVHALSNTRGTDAAHLLHMCSIHQKSFFLQIHLFPVGLSASKTHLGIDSHVED